MTRQWWVWYLNWKLNVFLSLSRLIPRWLVNGEFDTSNEKLNVFLSLSRLILQWLVNGEFDTWNRKLNVFLSLSRLIPLACEWWLDLSNGKKYFSLSLRWSSWHVYGELFIWNEKTNISFFYLGLLQSCFGYWSARLFIVRRYSCGWWNFWCGAEPIGAT